MDMLSQHTEEKKARRRGISLVALMLGSVLLAMVPAVSASHVESYHTARNPNSVATGDLDCDGDKDILTSSEMGNFLTVLYNDGGDYSERADLWVSNNASRRAGFADIADAAEVAIGDIDGDNVNDIVFFQGNIWVAGASITMGNITVITGDCSADVQDWSHSAPITVSPILYGMEVVDVDGDGNDDIVTLVVDETITNMEVAIYRGPNPTQATQQATTNVPISNTFYYDMNVGHWGETIQGGPITTDCEDLDVFLMTGPGYNPTTGFGAGGWDNMTVLEYDCTTNRFHDPTTSTTNTHVIKLDSEYSGDSAIADTDGDNVVDMMAMIQGTNVTYATRTTVGGQWTTGNIVQIGDYIGGDVYIQDIDQDGNMDFVVPTIYTVDNLNSAGGGSTISASQSNLRDINTVNIILNDGSGGWHNPQEFNVGRRPTMVMADQFTGGASSALDLVVGNRDYSFTFGNGARWIDSKGWQGAYDTISIIELDSQDVGITGLSVYPASWDPDTREMTIGEGQRDVNVTVRNTGLQSITGSVDVDVAVKEVVGGTDTVVYANDFDSAASGSCSGCALTGVSYSGEFPTTSWHVEQGSNNSGNGEDYEADTNPTDFMWAGGLYPNSTSNGNLETGYMSNWDEALILSDVDLTGADSASMDLDLFCAVSYSAVYYSSTGIADRIIYDDSCSIDVYSESSGWNTIEYFGGYDNDRYLHLANGYDPEYTVSNQNFFSGTLYIWIPMKGDDAVDLTPWAGETVDIRYRFRSGYIGSVGSDNGTRNSQFDGFAFDNLSINKTVTQFSANVQNVQQTLNLNNLGPGDEQVVTLAANFVNGTTYIIEADLSSTTGFTNGDSTNDDTVWKTTVKNLFDPAVEEITSFEKNQLYAAGDYPIEVEVRNAGNTVTDFDVEATVYNAIPNNLLDEDFEPGQGSPAYGDDGDTFGYVIDDTDPSISNSIMPGNAPAFGSSAYWFGHPDDGYGDDWDETMTLQTIDLVGNTADFVYLTFDYFAETDYLTDSDGDIVGIQEYGALEVEWRQGSRVYNGTIMGNWNDYNENGLQYNDTCEDIDDDGIYDETENVGDFGYNVFFDSEGLVKGVTLDLTHIYLLNTTSPSSADWDYNCTSLRDSEVTISYRFQSNGDGVNGNAGLAGFAVDNISVEEYVFTEEASYTTSITNLDSQETRTVNVNNHNFEQGIYRIDAISHFDNTTQGTAWEGAEEVYLANNVTRLIFEVASVDITLLRPNVLNCVEESVACVMPMDSVVNHEFEVPLINGVLAGDYNIKLKVTDMADGSVVYDQASDESPISVAPHDRVSASWANVYDGWTDGHTYNISFYAELTDGSPSGNNRYYTVTFADEIDVAILSNPTDQGRLDRVKEDLDAMGMTYTQFRVDDWETYVTTEWMEHYNKILLPWQTENNVENGLYYDQLSATRSTDQLSAMDIILNRMQSGATVQMHLGPYRTAYQGDKLPYGMDVLDRNTEGNYVTHDAVQVVDWHHPLMESVSEVAFIAFNGGHHVASAALDTSQVENTQIPQVCGGRIGAPLGTFHSLIQDVNDPSQSLLSTCNRGSGGLIITTIDVENPSVSDAYGSTTKPLLSNLLAYQVTPYPSGFGPAGSGFDMLINGETPVWDSLTQSYGTVYMKSSAEMDFDFTSTVEGLDADWELAPAPGATATNWDGNPLQAGETDHREDDAHSATFCVLDAQTGCRQDAEWVVTLYLHTEEGHTRSAKISLVTNDALADEFNPIPEATIIDRLEYRGQIDPHGTKTVADKEWDINLIRLGPTNDLTLHFDASNSSDADATDGSNGIKKYVWKVFFDNPWDQPGGSLDGHTYEVLSTVSHSWTYRFQNVTVDPSGQVENQIRIELTVIDMSDKPSLNEDKFRMYFVVVGEDYGDDEPVVEITSPASGSTQSADYVYVNGSVTEGSENGDVMIEIAFTEDDLGLSPTAKFSKKTQGLYNSTAGLGDGDGFSIGLKLADLYSEESQVKTIHIKITEGNGDRWTIYKSIDIELIPVVVDPCEEDPSAEGCEGDNNPSGTGEEGGLGLGMIAAIGGGGLLLVIIIIVSMLLVRRGGGSDELGGTVDSGGYGGAVTQAVDPVEQYVQQLVAQGYPEDTARAYAQQYYAQAAQQQAQQGGGYA